MKKPKYKLSLGFLLKSSLVNDEAKPLMKDLDFRRYVRKELEKVLKKEAEHPGKYTAEEIASARVILELISFLEVQNN